MKRIIVFFLIVAGFSFVFGQGLDKTQLRNLVAPFLGTPYVWGGTDPYRGIDCSAFVRYIYSYYGINLPRTSREQYASLPPATDDFYPGDLIFFSEHRDGVISHVALYLGDGWMIHSAFSRGGVHVDPVMKFAGIYVGVRRPILLYRSTSKISANIIRPTRTSSQPVIRTKANASTKTAKSEVRPPPSDPLVMYQR